MRQLDGSTIAIVGLGLMGGSLAAALSAYRNEAAESIVIRGVGRRDASIETALQRKFVDEGTCDLAAGVQDADVVVLGTPVRTSIGLLQQMAPWLKQGCVVTDLGSTKTGIAEAMEALPPHVDPIGGHPMCGKEVAGLQAAEAGLFQGEAYILTPLARTPDDVTGLMKEIIRAIGAHPIMLTPSRHDRLVAATSHLPYLLAACLVQTADDIGAEDQLVWEMVSSGFRDTTRLAGSDTTMMHDILMTNRENVRRMIALFRDNLTRFEEYLAHDDEVRLAELMTASRRRREVLFR